MSEEEKQISTGQTKYINDLTKKLTDDVKSQYIQKPIADLTMKEASNIIEALKELPENAPLSKTKVPPIAKDVEVETVRDYMPFVLTDETKAMFVSYVNAANAIINNSTISEGEHDATRATVLEYLIIKEYYNGKR